MVRKYIAFWAPKEIYSAHFFKKCFWASFCGRWQGVAESKCAFVCHFAPWAVAAGSAYSGSLDNQVPVRLLCAACSERVAKGRGTRSVYFPYAPGTGKADARLAGIVRQAGAGLAAGSFLPLGRAAAGRRLSVREKPGGRGGLFCGNTLFLHPDCAPSGQSVHRGGT